MTYEFAKKLKDAGFKQYGKGDHELSSYSAYTSGDSDSPAEKVYFPTLSELIEACGNELRSIYRYRTKEGEVRWEAILIEDPWDESKGFTVGSTPEEAVANLWLALQKK